MLGLHATHDESREIVEFKEDGVVLIQDEQQLPPLNSYLDIANDQLVNNIVSFLSRPVEITNFSWLSTADPGTELINPALNKPGLQLPFLWISKPMINQKLQGFNYLRCDLRVRVQVNAQPFNAGRLLVWFEPFAWNFASNVNQATSTKHFGGITGYRHVDLDLSESTAVELVVPYIGTLSHFNLVTGKGSLGNVRLTVYSKLTGTATANVDGTVWISAENVDLQMPTGLPLDIQPVSPTYLGRRVTAQIKSERKAAAKGTVQTIADATSSIAGQLGKVPIIGGAASAVSWVADAVSGVASIFGWSRPTDPAFATTVAPAYARHMNNYNGDSKAKSLAFDARNENSTPNFAFCSTEDEMTLAHMLQKQTYADRFLMDNLQAQNSIIWRWPVVPTACTKLISVAPNQKLICNSTMVSYIANLFRLWRGGINYHFKIVKTSFHSGRIRVLFVPGATLDTDVTTIDVDKCYSKIFDLRDTTQFEFEIPYVSNLLWQEIGVGANTLNPSAISHDRPTGMLYVEVLNQLRNPTTVANTIEFLVETSGAEDLQFAYLLENNGYNPINFRIPALSAATDKVKFIHGDSELPHMPQRVVSAQIKCEQFFDSPKKEYELNTMGIGEAITSFRQILKKYNLVGTIPPPVDVDHGYRIYPWQTNSNFSGNNEDVTPWAGLYNYISMLYRVNSGSMRVMFTPSESISVSACSVQASFHDNDQPITQATFYTSVPLSSIDSPIMGGPLVQYFEPLEGFLEVDVPFYEEMPINITPVGKPSFSSIASADRTSPCNSGTSIVLYGNAMPMKLYRSVGEDFSFGYSIGPPLNMADLA